MVSAALGFRVHSGWTAMVAIALVDGAPRLLVRERPHLVETFTFEFRQPYHTAERKPRAQAAAIVAHARRVAERLAGEAIDAASASLIEQGCKLDRCGLLLASGRPLPDLDRILASHALIHTADGELFREALLRAAAERNVPIFKGKESDIKRLASASLGLAAEDLTRRLAALGAAFGPPWTQDEKLAALIAWISLVEKKLKDATIESTERNTPAGA